MVSLLGDERSVLIASGLGDDTGGGLYELSSGGVDPIDRLSTTGFAVSPDGATLARLLFTDDDPQTSGELLLYDTRGVTGYRRIDALQEPHGAVWHRDELVVVSTLANRILWLDGSGTVLRAWEAPGNGDAWHLNSLAVAGGRLVASAFGRFASHRAWSRPEARAGRGVVFDVEAGTDLVTGLTCPHDPLPFDGGWLVCNSGSRELLRLSTDGRVLQRVPLGGWTRGLVCDGAYVYVGVSASRMLAAEGHAKVVALDRERLRVAASWDLPCREVYALAFVPRPLVVGLRTGFATNPFRLRERVVLDHGNGPVSGPLDVPDRRVRVVVDDRPSAVPAGSWITLRYSLHNHGGAQLVSVGDFPVLVGGRWLRDGVEVPGAVGRARLPSVVAPGSIAEGVLRVPTPTEAGSYRLRVAVGQDGVGWFDLAEDGFEPWERVLRVTAGS